MTLDYEVYKEGGVLNDRYQKIEDISEGSYGYVSLAKDIKEKKLVAIKYIFKLEDENEDKNEDNDMDDEDDRDGAASSQEKKTQLQRLKSRISSNVKSRLSNNICFEAIYEIDIQTKLGNDHKNIVKLLDFFDSYIILEYCSGGDLYEAIRNDLVPRKTKKISHILNQIIDAIQFIHSKNIYHRDLKPENILISNLFDWTIKISDFGLATTEVKSMDRNVGSERYMAPELFESNLDIEERKEPYQCDKVDVWSIGIVFLNIVFSKNPFSVANQSDKSFCYFAANREALFDVFSTMSLDFFQVLRHSLTIDPANRELEKMKFELTNLNSFTLDDDYYNGLDDDEVAISDDDSTHPMSTYIPPSSAPMPVSLPTPVASEKKSLRKKNNLQTFITPISNGDDVVNEVVDNKQRAKSVPKFRFQKRSHLQKNNNNNSNNNNNNNTNNNNNNNNNNYFSNNNNYNNSGKNFGKSIKNYNYQNHNNNYYNNNRYYNTINPKIIKHSRKPLGIPTPNTHINNFFNDCQKNTDSNDNNRGFNTRDFFTPPSVQNKYMEGIFAHRQNFNNSNYPSKQQNAKHSNNKNYLNNCNGNRQRKSINYGSGNERLSSPKSISSQYSPGKYIPPNARGNFGNQFLSNSPHVPDISTVLNGPSTFHEQYTSTNNGNSNNNVDLDDVLFTLEENDNNFINDMNSLSLNDPVIQMSNHNPESSAKNDFPDLLKSPVTKEQQLFTNNVNPFANQLLNPNGNNDNANDRRRRSYEQKQKQGVYIPPHHRKSSNARPSNPIEATLSVNNNALNYSTSFDPKFAAEKATPSNTGARSFLAPMTNHSSTTTAIQDSDIFAETNDDVLFFSDEEDDDTNDSPHERSMFGPYEIYNNDKNLLGNFHHGRKSSTMQSEAVGSLEQYKNNWLMLQQHQE